MSFESLSEFRRLLADLPGPDAGAEAAAADRNGRLTKPPGSLGRLEGLAVWYAGWRGDPRPRLARPEVLVFAGNHGVAALGVSAYPAEVTAQMVANFAAGGAAINQLARTAGAGLRVIPLALDRPTFDFTRGAAMEPGDLLAALRAGWEAVDPACDLLIPGEMGIGNTTSAAAIAAALFGGPVADWVGGGTGVGGAALARKIAVVEAGLAFHAGHLADPAEVLRRLGGREIAAMAAAILRARRLRIPVLLDGYIATAAAAVLHRIDGAALAHCLAGHLSAEAAHGRLLDRLGLAPLLALGLRLGEGSGAALAALILRAALDCHSGMATFAEAGVSEG